MNPLNRMNPGAVVTCNCEPVDGTLTCNGQHWRGDAVSAYPPKLAANSLYGKRDQAYTGNGYGAKVNPLLEEPETIDEHVLMIRARGVSLERWTRKHDAIATQGPIIREIIARMEGDLQQLRTLVKDIERAEKADELTPEQNARLAATSAEILARIAEAK